MTTVPISQSRARTEATPAVDADLYERALAIKTSTCGTSLGIEQIMVELQRSEVVCREVLGPPAPPRKFGGLSAIIKGDVVLRIAFDPTVPRGQMWVFPEWALRGGAFDVDGT